MIDCMDAIRPLIEMDTNIGTNHDLLPENAADMWNAYTHTPCAHLQHRLTSAVEKAALSSLLASLSATERARMISAGAAPSASASAAPNSTSIAGLWLTALPTHAEYSLSAAEFRMAARHRLGLRPADAMPLSICMCNKGNFNMDAQHFQSCSFLKRLPLLHRHNGIANVVARTASLAHFNVAHEFIGRQLIADMPTQNRDHNEGDDGAVPDIVVTGPGLSAFVDVAVSCPVAPSYAQRASRDFAYVADLRAQAKHSKYDEHCARMKPGLEMIPFCLESLGVLHHEAYAFLTRICMHADVGARSSLLKHALISLSFALQRGNAWIAMKGLAMLRLHVIRMPNRRIAF
jgi:hypothetical protein